MTKVKTQPATDMPVTARNAANSATIRASGLLRDMRAELGSLRAVSDELGKRGYSVNKGYLSNVINLNRHANKELLIALGIRKPRKVLSEAEREAQREKRKISAAMYRLCQYANADCKITIEHRSTGGWSDNGWLVIISPSSMEKAFGGLAPEDYLPDAIWSAIDGLEEWRQFHRNDKTN